MGKGEDEKKNDVKDKILKIQVEDFRALKAKVGKGIRA